MSNRQANEKTEDAPPRGVMAACLTPLRDDLAIDHDALCRHAMSLLRTGCDGIALFGTTGEAASLSADERMRALEAVLAGGVARDRVLVGTASCAVPDVVRLSEHGALLGVAGMLVLPPFYYKAVSDEGVFEFYRRVVEKTDGSGTRLYIYHFPRMTGVPVGEGVIERLLARYPERVAGIKDSGGEWEHTKRLIDRFPSLGVFPGSEVFLLDGVRAGAAGCISATVNVTAPLAAEVFARREEPAADRLQTKLTGIRREFERYPLIAGLKHVMWRRTGDSKWLNIRPPLCRLGEAAGDELVQKLEGSGA